MNDKKNSFMFNILIGNHDFAEDEYIFKYKFIALSTLINVLVVALSLIALLRYADGNISQAMIDAGLVGSFIVSSVILRFSKKSFKIISRILLLLALSVAALQLVWYPESKSRIAWFSTMVYVGFFLLDRREGWLWVSTIIAGLIGIYFYEPSFIALSHMEFATFIINLLLIAILLNWYEKIKEEGYTIHAKHKRELEEAILLKTQELQQLNATLHNRVDMEIDKNRNKDKQMIHQSRLAQMGEMISMIAHQWRQPLAAISATASALQLKVARKKYDEEVFLDSIKQINEYSQHLSSTIDDFRNFFSPNKEKSLFRLKECIEGSIKIIGSSLSNKNIEVTTEILCDEEIYSYPNEIRQVILNLLKNAEDILVEKQIENPWIHIRVNELGPMQIVEIADNAGGVPEEIKDKIFDPYFTTKTKRDGTGLGLYMSKTIIEDNCGGKIDVYNGSQGAVFELSFRKKA